MQDDALFTDRLATVLVIRTLFDNRSYNATSNAIIVWLALFKTPNHKDFGFSRTYGSNDRVSAHAYRPIHLWKGTATTWPILVNILFMAPRMVYCSIINLLWSLKSKCVASDFVTPVREQGP